MPSAPVINGKYTIKVWKTNDKARFLIYFRDAGKLCMKRIFLLLPALGKIIIRIFASY
jgi:hypothetical protein